PPRYFDVTLQANGMTTLDTAVTIDRLTMSGVGAGLNITSTGSLFSNIDITQLTGTLHVDGQLRTPGDFFMMTGGLSGGGTITAPYFTNMAGVIAPGTPETIGTLTFDGDVILASGSTLMINLGASGASDVVAVTGHANLGGLVSFSPTAGTLLRDGYTYTFLTAQGGLSDTFSTAAISAILTPKLTYTADSVQMEIEAGLYADVVTDSPIQAAYAQLLDQNRVQYDQRANLYGPLDIMDAPSIQASLEAMAPRAETLKTAIGTTAVDSMARFYRNRMASATRDDLDGSLQVIGRPIEYASVAMDSLDGGSISPVGETGSGTLVQNALPDNMRGFIAAGYLDGKGAPMATATGGGEDEFDGYFISAGIEAAVGARQIVGVAVSGTDLSGSTAVLPQSAEGQLWQAAVYGRYQSDSGLFVTGQVSLAKTTLFSVLGQARTLNPNIRNNALSLNGAAIGRV
ncbi:MAG: autotransporter domain-containing protein, partial [Alphaproteobacteria bacterium HGW-Alphaproteobacteria-15]